MQVPGGEREAESGEDEEDEEGALELGVGMDAVIKGECGRTAVCVGLCVSEKG